MTLTKKIAAGVVALGLCALAAVPAFAASNTGSVTNGTTATDQTDSAKPTTPIKIETEASTLSVTVPTQMTMVFQQNGDNSIPTTFQIDNNSAGAIVLNSITYTGANGWGLAVPTGTYAELADSKDINIRTALGAGAMVKTDNTVKATSGKASFGSSYSQAKIAKDGNVIVSFEVDRPAYTTSTAANDTAFSMAMEFALDK